MNHILIVEDELKLARLEADYLQNAGFDTRLFKQWFGGVAVV